MRITENRALGALVIVALILVAIVAPALSATHHDARWVLLEDVDLSDASRWVADTGQASNTASYDVPENITFSRAGVRVHGAPGARGLAAYTSGDAKGMGIRIPNYARVEAVGSAPFGEGLWPALLWLRPQDDSAGEIDLMEMFGSNPRVASAVHNEYGPTHRNTQNSLRWSALANADPAGTHTYVLEKTPHRIEIRIDGVTMLDVTPRSVPSGFDWDAVFERPETVWYPRVTLQIGCGAANPHCGIGLPSQSWQGADVKLLSLRIWRLDDNKAR